MLKNQFLLRLILFAVLLASACVPAETEPTEQALVTAVKASPTPLVDVPSSTQEGSEEPTLELTPTQPVEVLPAVTARAPELHATDPTTVDLATGQLHFVEFFRFT